MPVVKPIVRQAASTWMWSFVLVNTVWRFVVGMAATRLYDPHRALGHTMRVWARRNMRYCGFTCDPAALDVPAPALLVVNHQHFFDIQLLAALIPPPLYFVARLEVGGVPLIGSMLRRGGHVLIARGSGNANDDALETATARLAEGGRVVVFGEGTRSKDGSIHTLRSGAFRMAARAGVPLVPVVLAGTRSAFPRGWWPALPTRLRAAVLPARPVSEEQARSIAFRDGVREEMAAKLAELLPGTGPKL